MSFTRRSKIIVPVLVCVCLFVPTVSGQTSTGRSYQYDGWYYDGSRTTFNVTVTTVDSVITINSSQPLPEVLSSYIGDWLVLDDVSDLPRYTGVSHTSWRIGLHIVELETTNGIHAYDANTGVAMLMDVDVNNVSMLLIENRPSVTDPMYNVLIVIGGVAAAAFVVGLLVYSLYIYPKIVRRNEKRKEVKLGAKRKKQTKKTSNVKQ